MPEQGHPMTGTPNSASTNRALRCFAARRPEWFAVLAVVAYTLPPLAVGLIAPQGASFTPTADPVALAMLAWGVLVPVALLTMLDWWAVAGFSTRSTWRSLAPFLPMILLYNLLPLPTLAVGVTSSDTGYFLLLAITVLAAGFGDEATFRGVVLQTLLPRGVYQAVIISSVLFGAAYLRVMALDVHPVHVGAQAANSVGMGIAFAALVVVTRTIWPLVLISAASQIVFYLTYVPNSHPGTITVVIELLMGALAAAYGIWLLHRHGHRHVSHGAGSSRVTSAGSS